jgi:hypothetical protein
MTQGSWSCLTMPCVAAPSGEGLERGAWNESPHSTCTPHPFASPACYLRRVHGVCQHETLKILRACTTKIRRVSARPCATHTVFGQCGRRKGALFPVHECALVVRVTRVADIVDVECWITPWRLGLALLDRLYTYHSSSDFLLVSQCASML